MCFCHIFFVSKIFSPNFSRFKENIIIIIIVIIIVIVIISMCVGYYVYLLSVYECVCMCVCMYVCMCVCVRTPTLMCTLLTHMLRFFGNVSQKFSVSKKIIAFFFFNLFSFNQFFFFF